MKKIREELESGSKDSPILKDFQDEQTKFL